MTSAAKHSHCCDNLRVKARTPNQVAALPYPSDQAQKDEGQLNRLHNSEKTFVKKSDYVGSHAKMNYARHKNWWFKIEPGKTPMLDGSSDGIVRGYVDGSGELKEGIHAVCLNAASLKLLKRPAGLLPNKHSSKDHKMVLCAFSWQNRIVAVEPEKKPGDPPATMPKKKKTSIASGWIPLECLVVSDAARKKLMGDLEHWKCCIHKYGDWGRRGTSKKTQVHYFLTAPEIHQRLLGLSADKPDEATLKRFFEERSKGSIHGILKDWRTHPDLKIGGRAAFPEHGLIGVVAACSKGNMITDYAARTPDWKKGAGGQDGYVNLCPNAVGTAPIPIDVFPTGQKGTHFHVMHWTKPAQKAVRSQVFLPPQIHKAQLIAGGHADKAKKIKTVKGTLIGHAIWYFGYCEVIGMDPEQRRYGWVPALALRSPSESIPHVADPFPKPTI